MLRIAPQFLEQVKSAETGADLHEMVEHAIRLEFSTIPPYLTAMLSLHPGTNREIWSQIHEVVVEEMLHMTIASNLLNAIGGTPSLNTPDFLPTYPGPLPMAIGGGLIVTLEKFSLDQVRNVFMEIEEPEKPIDIPSTALAVPAFSTIGGFYEALKAQILAMGDAIFTGEPSRQVVPTDWFGGKIFPVLTASDAARAIDLIVEEGEGTPDSPLDPDGEFAHYYKFEEISKLRRIKADPNSPVGFSFSGDAIAFDDQAVWNITPNQKLSDLDRNSLAGRRASQFSFVYSKLMNALHSAFTGAPEQFEVAMGLMFELKLAGQMLVQIPAVSNGQPTGLNAGPVFEYSSVPV
ncbi:ferritin-like protein [Sedimentitalea sp.]|uniref:ferritin-like domain-containing protein n=1 Tax=Sedimentitalea sp. TaxID=2048915 RepID=UPI0032972CAB